MMLNRIILSTFLFSVLSVPCFVFFHEFTHVYENDFRFSKFCFLDCPSSSEVGYTNFGENKVDQGSPIAGVWLDEPKNVRAVDEGLANGVGLISVVGLFVSCLFLILTPNHGNQGLGKTF